MVTAWQVRLGYGVPAAKWHANIFRAAESHHLTVGAVAAPHGSMHPS